MVKKYKFTMIRLFIVIPFVNRYAKYKIGFDQSGKIMGVIVNFYCDSGNSPNGKVSFIKHL